MRDGPGNLPPTRCAQAGSHAPLLVRGREASIQAVNQARTRTTVLIAEINHREEEDLLWDEGEAQEERGLGICGTTE